MNQVPALHLAADQRPAAATATAVPGAAGLTAGGSGCLPSTHLEQGHQLVDSLGRQLLEEEEAQQQAHQLLPPALVAGADRVRQRAQHLLDPHPLRAHQGQRVGTQAAMGRPATSTARGRARGSQAGGQAGGCE